MESHSRYSLASASLNISVFVYLPHNLKNAFYSSFSWCLSRTARKCQNQGLVSRLCEPKALFPDSVRVAFIGLVIGNMVRKGGSFWLVVP